MARLRKPGYMLKKSAIDAQQPAQPLRRTVKNTGAVRRRHTIHRVCNQVVNAGKNCSSMCCALVRVSCDAAVSWLSGDVRMVTGVVAAAEHIAIRRSSFYILN